MALLYQKSKTDSSYFPGSSCMCLNHLGGVASYFIFSINQRIVFRAPTPGVERRDYNLSILKKLKLSKVYYYIVIYYSEIFSCTVSP